LANAISLPSDGDSLGASKYDAPSGRQPHAPLVSVIIPHYDDLENLERCLSLLATQTMSKDEVEVIVADNNSRCGMVAVKRVCNHIAKVVPAPIQSAAEARNAGVRASHGRYLAFLDSDCRPSLDWLARGIAALATADMAGGRVDVAVADTNNLTGVEAFERVFAFNFKRYIEQKGFSGAGNMFVPREIFDKVGGFRANRGSEDIDWGQRAVALGYRWQYASDACVSHPARHDWMELKRKWRRLIEESYSASREKPFGGLRWILRSWVILLSPFLHTATILRSRKLDCLDQRLKAIVVLFRLRWWRFMECHRVLLGRR
jgi:cellulose synthase/poly-beta-1,6-N-acetylglucosamine synthase-like glycosyltransferase